MFCVSRKYCSAERIVSDGASVKFIVPLSSKATLLYPQAHAKLAQQTLRAGYSLVALLIENWPFEKDGRERHCNKIVIKISFLCKCS